MKILSFFLKHSPILFLILLCWGSTAFDCRAQPQQSQLEQAKQKIKEAGQSADDAQKHASGQITDPSKAVEAIRKAKAALEAARTKLDEAQKNLDDSSQKSKQKGQNKINKARTELEEAAKKIQEALKQDKLAGEKKATEYEERLKKMGQEGAPKDSIKTELRDSAYAAAKKNPGDAEAVKRKMAETLKKILDRLSRDVSESGKERLKWFKEKFPPKKEDKEGNPSFPDQAYYIQPQYPPADRPVSIWQPGVAVTTCRRPAPADLTIPFDLIQERSFAPEYAEKLHERFGGPFIIGLPVNAYTPSVALRAHTSAWWGFRAALRYRERVEASVDISTTRTVYTGNFPISVAQPDATDVQIHQGALEAKARRFSLGANTRWFLGRKKMQAFVAGGARVFWSDAPKASVQMADLSIPLGNLARPASYFAAEAGGGCRIHFHPKIFLEGGCYVSKQNAGGFQPEIAGALGFVF